MAVVWFGNAVAAICLAPHLAFTPYQWVAGAKGSVYVKECEGRRLLQMRGQPPIPGGTSMENA